MTIKTKGRPLPPLLPVEYCTIGRAAKMLDCEPEDLLHWAEIGAVSFWIDVVSNIQPSTVSLFLLERDYQNLIAMVKKQNSEPLLGQYTLDVGRSSMLLDDDLYQYKMLKKDEPWQFLELESFYGLWKPEFLNYKKLLINQIEKISTFYSDHLDGQFFIANLDVDVEIKINDLLIIKSDLDLIYQSITKGKSLKSRFNDPDIAKEMQKKDSGRAHEHKPERVTGGISKATLALTDLVFKLTGEDSNLINNPHKAHSRINKLLRDHKANPEGGYDLGISDNAFRDIISKARSTQQNEK